MLEKWCLASNKQAEQAALAYVILVKEMPLWFNPEYFTGYEYRLAKELISQWNEIGDINANILPDELKDAARVSLLTVADGSDDLGNNLTELFGLRTVGKTIVECLNDDELKSTEKIQKIQDTASSILSGSMKVEYNHAKAILSLVEELRKAQGNTSGAACGLSGLDNLTSGFEQEKIYTIGALKKTGKSRFMVWLASKFAFDGKKVLINSLEMPAMRINSLALSRFSQIDSSRFGKKLVAHEFPMLEKGTIATSALDWKIYCHRTLPEIRSRIMYERAHGGCEFVFVDFIQRMESLKYPKDRVREVEDIAKGLADITRDTGVCMIEFSQLTGMAESLPPETIPDMSHYKESQGIAENSDCIITLHNPKRKEIMAGDYKPVEMKVRVEQRYGVSGGVATIMADLRICDFKEQDTQHDEPEYRWHDNN